MSSTRKRLGEGGCGSGWMHFGPNRSPLPLPVWEGGGNQGRFNLNALIALCQALCVCPSARPPDPISCDFGLWGGRGRAWPIRCFLYLPPSKDQICAI